MERHNVTRSGSRPYQFTGEIVDPGGKVPVGPGRWDDYRIWRTQQGRWVGQVARITIWEGSQNEYLAIQKSTRQEVAEWIAEQAPVFATELLEDYPETVD